MGRTRKGLRYEVRDAKFFEAKKRGFVARSALKLEELDQKHRILKPGLRVLDLGCAPGSWLQYAARRVGVQGQIVGVDIEEVRVSLPQVKTFVADLMSLSVDDERIHPWVPFDVFQSDAMVKTSGIAEADCAKSIALVERALFFAERGWLKPGGAFLAKVFEGPGFTPFYVAFKKMFAGCSVNKPQAIRSGSREVYILGQSFRAPYQK